MLKQFKDKMTLNYDYIEKLSAKLLREIKMFEILGFSLCYYSSKEDYFILDRIHADEMNSEEVLIEIFEDKYVISYRRHTLTTFKKVKAEYYETKEFRKVKNMARRWNISQKRLKKMCEAGEVMAIKASNEWMIYKNQPSPKKYNTEKLVYSSINFEGKAIDVNFKIEDYERVLRLYDDTPENLIKKLSLKIERCEKEHTQEFRLKDLPCSYFIEREDNNIITVVVFLNDIHA